MTVDRFLLAPYLLTGSEMVTLMLERAISLLSALTAMRALDPPVAIPDITQSPW